MTEEEKIFAGGLFWPGHPDLKAMKLRSHRLSEAYNRTSETETELRATLLREMLGEIGEGSFIQGPVFFHYGKHTRIGHHFFGNYNLTVQDDAPVTIGNHCDFGPGVTIVTPQHPLLPMERLAMRNEEGEEKRLCYAEPVKIGNHCWLGAGVTVCPGVTVGDNCVIGAGSVVTRDIPANSVAAGVPCRVIRSLSKEDSMKYRPELLGGCSVIED
jgi:maltose O-acetyltransferase